MSREGTRVTALGGEEGDDLGNENTNKKKYGSETSRVAQALGGEIEGLASVGNEGEDTFRAAEQLRTDRVFATLVAEIGSTTFATELESSGSLVL